MILVTGATGFVGTALTADLNARGLACRPVSRVPRDGYVTIPEMTGATDWSQALDGVDTVIHLAARAHITRETEANPLAVYRAVNVAATENLASQAASAGVRRFIFCSTIGVNGRSTPARPFTEDADPKPEDAYAQSKLEAEQHLWAIGRETGMEIVVIRPPLVYGPGVRANFASLMAVARKGLPLPLASVNNRRSFVFVGNLTDLIVRCIDHPRAANQVFLVSDGDDLSTADLLSRVARAYGRRSNVFPFPVGLLQLGAAITGKAALAERLLASLQVDIGKARSVLGWSPPYSVDHGLRLAVDADRKARTTS